MNWLLYIAGGYIVLGISCQCIDCGSDDGRKIIGNVLWVLVWQAVWVWVCWEITIGG